MFESGRAHLLMAKCLVASNNNINSQHSTRRRLSVLESSKHLKKAETCFRAAGDGQRVKDVLYMAVRIRKILIVIVTSGHPIFLGASLPLPGDGDGEEPGFGRIQEA